MTPLRHAFLPPLLAMLLSSCATPSPHVQLAVPQPSEAQLQGCADAKLAPAGRADDQALQLEKTAVADWGACYYDRYWSLVGWVRHELMARK